MGLSENEQYAVDMFDELEETYSQKTTHGESVENLEKIAELWSVYLDQEIEPHEAGQMLVLFKVAREAVGEPVRDHFVDQAGYSGLAGAAARESKSDASERASEDSTRPNPVEPETDGLIEPGDSVVADTGEKKYLGTLMGMDDEEVSLKMSSGEAVHLGADSCTVRPQQDPNRPKS